MNKAKLLPSLLIFAEVAKRGSFTQAANALNMSKSAVSQQISKLEQVVGCQLMVRNTRGLSLTPTANKLLQRCELLLDQVDMAFNELQNIEDMPTGTLSITVGHALEQNVALPAISQLCQEFPTIEPNLIVTDKKLDLVQDKLDIALFAGEPKDSGYRALPIGEMTEIWCASPAFVNKHGFPSQPDQLQNFRWIATLWQKNNLRIFDQANQRLSMPVSLTPFARANTLSSAISMTLHNMGILLLPDVTAMPLINSNQLVPIMPNFTGPKWPVYMVHGFGAVKPRHITRFHQLVSHFFHRSDKGLTCE